MDDRSQNGQSSHGASAGATGRLAGDPTAISVASEMHLWIPPGSEVSSPSQNDRAPGRRHRLSKRRLRVLSAVLAILVIGAGVLYWRANIGIVKTNNAQTNGDLSPISPRISGNVLRVFVEEHDYL